MKWKLWISETPNKLPQCTPEMTRQLIQQMSNAAFFEEKCKPLCEKEFTTSSTSTVSLNGNKLMEAIETPQAENSDQRYFVTLQHRFPSCNCFVSLLFFSVHNKETKIYFLPRLCQQENGVWQGNKVSYSIESLKCGIFRQRQLFRNQITS